MNKEQKITTKELKTDIKKIEKTLDQIKDGVTSSRWKLVKEGFWRAVGYMVGIILAILFIGWILNLLGVFPFLNNYTNKIQNILEGVKTSRAI